MKCLKLFSPNRAGKQPSSESSTDLPRTGIARTKLVAAVAAMMATSALAAPSVYTHRSANGSVVFSDSPMVNGEVVRTSYQAEYGRPVATASCMGLNSVEMARRAKSFYKTIESAAVTHNIDANLIRAVAQVESCFDRNAVSRVGAQGVMQLMPATAIELGVTDSFNVEQNINGGARYLALMMNRFNHNHRLALAAYNAGPGAVEKHQGIPPFPETVDYVSKVLNIYKPKP